MSFHLNWIHVAILVVILLKVISNDGDWFDFLQQDARYENRCANFEFEAMVWIFWIVLIGVAVVALLL